MRGGVKSSSGSVLAFVMIAGLLVAVPPTVGWSQTADPWLEFEQPLIRWANAQRRVPALPPGEIAGRRFNTELVGKNRLDDRGFNADVWVHGNFAYVGQWGFGGGDLTCPSPPKAGVKVLNISDPSRPRVVATLQNPARTTAEDIVVFTAIAGPLAGRDIAAVGIQACFSGDPTNFRGLQLFDVTNPRTPVELAQLDTGFSARGVHELWVTQRTADSRILALLAIPFSEDRDVADRGDLRIVDITDPRAPVEVADWGIRKDLGEPTGSGVGQGSFRARFAHSAYANGDGTRAFLSYWDFGVVILDITNPAAPTFTGRTVFRPKADGDTHSVWLTGDEQHLLTADEDTSPGQFSPDSEVGWGYLRIFSLQNLGRPDQVASFKTRRSKQQTPTRPGDFTIHNPYVKGNTAYLSWYSDGVRILDIADPTAPAETAYFIPPAVADPVGYFPTAPLVWGVVTSSVGTERLVFASDINAGLYVFRVTAPAAARK